MVEDADLSEYVWIPTPEFIAGTRETAFLNYLGLRSFEELDALARDDAPAFWDGVLKFIDLRFYQPYHTVMDASAGIEWTRWCLGGTTNLVLNCIDRHRETPHYDKEYLIWRGEDGADRRFTYRAFDGEMSRFASALKTLGVGRGDVVALYMPLIPEALMAYFAAIKIGGVVMPLFSGFGAGAIRDRLDLARPKVVVTADGTLRRGQRVLMKPVLDEALDGGEVKVVTVARLGVELPWNAAVDHRWADLVAAGDPSCPTEEMVADDPCILHFTSGTTGRPKGGIYTHVGIATKMALDHGILSDFRDSDRHFCMADMGWMVGSKLAVLPTVHGGSLVIAEGLPDYPEPDRYWALMAEHKATFTELSPALVRLMMTYGEQRVLRHDLSAMRVIITGGEPWTERPWRWLFDVVGKGRVPIVNSAGGTEVSGSILQCDLHHPMKVGSFTIAIPGMGADVVDPEGNPVPPGVFGELIMRQPSIGLIKGLWNESERYIENYWRVIPGVWVHGDFATRDADGQWFLHGRSDDTLKISGKRVGPAEIENILMNGGRFRECAAVGTPDEKKGASILLACVPMPGVVPGPGLEQEVMDAIAANLGRSFRPDRVLFVRDLPKTRNMKIMRRAVRAAITGQPTGDLSALTNPEAIEEIRAAALVANAG
jgi:acetyl-CoA synthetase